MTDAKNPGACATGADLHCGGEVSSYTATGSKSQPISRRASTTGKSKFADKEAPSWVLMMAADYGPSSFLANAEGTQPRVMLRVEERGVTTWVGASPWGSGDRRREFPGATLASPTVRAYADGLVAMLRDMAIERQAARQHRRSLRSNERRGK